MSDEFFAAAIVAVTVLGAVVLVRGWVQFVRFMEQGKRARKTGVDGK